MKEQKYKRRSYPLVKRSYQYYFLALVLGYMLVVVIFMAAFLFIPDFLAMQDMTIDLTERAYAAEKVLSLHTRLWPAILALIRGKARTPPRSPWRCCSLTSTTRTGRTVNRWRLMRARRPTASPLPFSSWSRASSSCRSTACASEICGAGNGAWRWG